MVVTKIHGDGATARESTGKEFDELRMRVGEPVREYITRAKGLAAAVRYHGIDVTDKQSGN